MNMVSVIYKPWIMQMINSLDCFRPGVVRPTLIALAFHLILGSLQAERPACSPTGSADESFAITVTAPPDLTIEINNSSVCDTLVNIPPATFNSSCLPLRSIQTITAIGTLNSNGGSLVFPAGIYPIVFLFTDNCGATDSDTMMLSVYDATPPHIVCQPEQVIYLNNSGEGNVPAFSLDGGSYDDCGHVWFKIKRMSPPVGYACTLPANPGYQFDDQLLMCCMDMTAPVNVILRVYDVFPGSGAVSDSLHFGHFMDCMVRVSVGDKLAPTLDCPPDLTVQCGFDYDSLFKIQRPYLEDNCSNITLDSQIVRRLNGCSAGYVDRIYRATDPGGLQSTCTQRITVQIRSLFDGLDSTQLKWPGDSTIYACRIDPNSIQAGLPEIREAECDQIQLKMSDDRFSFSQGGVCTKILRRWEVINWCIYNPDLRPNPRIPANGYYSQVQVIMVVDTTRPLISSFGDTTLYNLSAECGESDFTLPAFGATDCGLSSGISFSYQWDLGSDGTRDSVRNGNIPSRSLPNGVHSLYLFAMDSCHNLAQKSLKVTVKDGKAPSPNVLYGVSTNLVMMQNGPMVMASASLFNHKSSDNCTPEEKLRFSFSPDPNDTLRTYTCDSVGFNLFDLYVWDECGNYSIAQTYLEVMDSDGLCPSTVTAKFKLDGVTTTYYGMELPDVKVGIANNFLSQTVSTDTWGRFEFPFMTAGTELMIDAWSDEEHLDGVTTADILRIQKHILGQELIKDPYELIAADVDQSGHVSARDISLIRQLILGKTDHFPSGKSILCLDKNHRFSDPANPWSEFKKMSSPRSLILDQDLQLQLLGIKLGDLNRSMARRNLYPDQNKAILWIEKQDPFWIIRSGFDGSLEALQMSWALDPSCSLRTVSVSDQLDPVWDPSFVHVAGNEVKMSAAFSKAVPVQKGDPLFVFETEGLDLFCHSEPVLSASVVPELCVQNQQAAGIAIHQIQAENIRDEKEFSILQWGPNPFQDEFDIVLSVHGSSNIKITVTDLLGKNIFEQTRLITGPVYAITLDKGSFPNSGLFHVKIETEKYSETLRVIRQ